jgi:predicted nucleic acid-binding protein
MGNPPLGTLGTVTPHVCIGLDSCVLIYHLEGHQQFAPVSSHVIDQIEAGRISAVISSMALLEILVGPYRREAEPLAKSYYSLLRQLPNCRWVDMTYEIADRAAQIRAKYNLKVPDAIHIATAIESGATAFITNDLDLPRIDGIEVVQIASL